MSARDKAAALRRQMAKLAQEADALENAPDLEALPNHTVVRFTRTSGRDGAPLTYAAIKVDGGDGLRATWWTTSGVHARKQMSSDALIEWLLDASNDAVGTLEIWQPAEVLTAAPGWGFISPKGDWNEPLPGAKGTS